MPEVKSVWRSRIVVPEDLLPRVAYDDETARRYLELLREGHKFPPVVVFDLANLLGKLLYLVDGTYRLWALDELRGVHGSHPTKFKVKVEIHQGTQSEALWYAAGANQHHGLPLTHSQRLVALSRLLTDPTISKKSDRTIAKQCGLSPTTVGTYRPEAQSTIQFGQSDPREGADGRTIDTSNIGRRDTEAAGATANQNATTADGRSPDPCAGAGLDAPAVEAEAAPAPAEWPESIKDVMLQGTKILQNLASACRAVQATIRDIALASVPGTDAFHAQAAIERMKQLTRAVTASLPYCVCPDCRAEGKPCNRCRSLGWVVRALLDETEPTENQVAQLELRGVAIGGMPKAEAARQLDDLFAAETWQERRKLNINAEPPERDF